MWDALRRSPKADPDVLEAVSDLLRSTSQDLIQLIGVVFLLGLLATAIWPEQIGTPLWIVAPPMLLLCFVAYRLLQRHFFIAHLLWQAGLLMSIAGIVVLLRAPELALLFVLLPLITTATLGWQVGLGMVVLISGCAWGLRHGMIVPVPSAAYSYGIVGGGLLTWATGWGSSRALLTVTAWSLYNYRQAQANLIETQEHRGKLSQFVKDLDQASYRLEQANRMLVLARAEAEEAREARNRFALAISHELRTPLNFVIGFSELMVNSPETYAPLETWPAGLYEDAQEIYRSSTHLLRLVNDVLDLGQIDSLQMALLKEWIDPAQVVEEVEAMVRPAFARKRLTLATAIAPDLPHLFADHTRIRQVLLNLCSNSLRFTERGGVTVRAWKESPETVLFCVEDTGVGIAGEDIPKLFEPFRQVGSRSWQRRDGAGLGLAISRRFIELHGGKMWVESELGAGTRFYFSLPVSEALRAPSYEQTFSDVNTRYWRYLQENAERQRVVLVLSADPVAGDVIRQYIPDFEVINTTRADHALAQVLQFFPCALMLDQALLDGGSIAETLEALPYDLPVITFAFPGAPATQRGLPAGVVDYLVKPVNRAIIRDAVESLGPDVHSLLIVDDDPAMVRLIMRSLTADAPNSAAIDYELRTSYSGTEAIAAVAQARPDAILLDIALPDMTGWDVVEALRPEGIPVILITAHDWVQTLPLQERPALSLTMRRPLARHELPPLLSTLLKTVRPVYPAAPGSVPGAEPPE